MARQDYNLKDAICLGPPKEAALYFDRVFPFDLAQSLLGLDDDPERLSNYIPFKEGTFEKAVVRDLLGGKAADADSVYTHLTNIAFVMSFVKLARSNPGSAERFLDESRRGHKLGEIFARCDLSAEAVFQSIVEGSFSFDVLTDRLSRQAAHLSADLGFDAAPVWTESAELAHQEDVGLVERYLISLRGFKVVDASSVSWDKLLEFRKDREARSALRDLRLFFSESFADKDPSYISDKLDSLVEHHEKSVRLWGFDTVNKSLSAAISSQSVIASSMGAVASFTAGLPLALAAAAGATFGVGACMLEFGRVYLDAKRSQVDSPTRYLTLAKKRLT